MIRRRFALTLSLVLAGLLLVSCGFAESLEILCAPAMRKPIEEMRTIFQKQTKIDTQISYEGSGALLAQLKLKSRDDLFIPADRFYTDEAIKAGLAESPRVFAYLVPVIMVQKGNPKKITKLQDLRNPKLRVGLEDPRLGAIGKVTDQVLKKNKISPKKLNVVYWSAKVDELANAIKLRSIDATIVWKPVAIQYPKDATIIEIPEKQNVVAPVSAAIIKSSKKKAAAMKFLLFMTSPAGKSILAKYKYPTSAPIKKK